MSVIYDGKALIPAPMLKYETTYQTRSDGTKIGQLFGLTLTNKMLSSKGSPASDESLWDQSGYPQDEEITGGARMASIESKQESIRQLFSVDGKWLEWSSPDGSVSMRCKPRIKSISFGDGSQNDTWTQICDYTIEAEADILYLNNTPVSVVSFDDLISDAEETWEIADGDVIKTFKVTHTVRAVGKRKFSDTGVEEKLPWEYAKDFVKDRIGIGFSATTTFSPTGGSTIASSSNMSGGSIDFSDLTAYNISRGESIDEAGGSYSLTETWTLAASAGTDIYTISLKKISDQPYTTIEVGIQGTIKGFYSSLNDYDARNTNALSIWNDLKGNPLYDRVQSYVESYSDATLNTHAITGTIDANPFEGTISYNYQFSDRSGDDYYEDYVVSKKGSAEDFKVSINIQGKITGRRFDTDTDPNLKFNRALARWTIVKEDNFLYNRIIDDFYPELSSLLMSAPIEQNVDMDQANGIISYSFTFDTRQNVGGDSENSVVEEFSVSSSYSREDGKTNYTIQGTVRGLAIGSPSDPQGAKYAAASGYFDSVTVPNLSSRVSTYAAINGLASFNSTPLSLEVERNVSVGVITYNYKYNNVASPCVPGALSESISVNDDNWNGDVNIFAKIPIPFRTKGPIFQDMKTTPEKVRSVSIETVMPPTGQCDWISAYNAAPDYESKLTELKPEGTVFVGTNTKSWDWKNGRYARNISWIYQ